jgi:hypothetical protein
MEMESHVDEDLLDMLIENSICTSKTEAAETAFREMDRKARFKEMLKRHWKQTSRVHFHMRQGTRGWWTHG